MLPLTDPAQIRDVHRRRYPDGLVCDACGRLLASTGYALRPYTCAECRAEAAAAATLKVQRAETLRANRTRARLSLADVEALEGPWARPRRGIPVPSETANAAPEGRINTGDSRASSVTAAPGTRNAPSRAALRARKWRKGQRAAHQNQEAARLQRQRDRARASRARRKTTSAFVLAGDA
jgi:hypothetical protein